jgi:hypothetical protein
LAAINVPKIAKKRRWTDPTSRKPWGKDIGCDQRPENHKKDLDGSDVRKTERGKTLIAANV